MEIERIVFDFLRPLESKPQFKNYRHLQIYVSHQKHWHMLLLKHRTVYAIVQQTMVLFAPRLNRPILKWRQNGNERRKPLKKTIMVWSSISISISAIDCYSFFLLIFSLQSFWNIELPRPKCHTNNILAMVSMTRLRQDFWRPTHSMGASYKFQMENERSSQLHIKQHFTISDHFATVETNFWYFTLEMVLQ